MTAPFDPELARGWCLDLARSLERTTIDRDGAPYLTRYFVGGWAPFNRNAASAVFLHHFVASDPLGAVHSHPWDGLSLILYGGYREYRCAPDGELDVVEYLPGSLNVIMATDKHRIDLLASECWSLFLTGPYLQPWAFFPGC